MKLSDFKNKLNTFVQEWASEQPDGKIKMQSHDCEMTISFFDPEGNELEDITFEFDQFIGFGCVSGLRINFKSKEII